MAEGNFGMDDFIQFIFIVVLWLYLSLQSIDGLWNAMENNLINSPCIGMLIGLVFVFTMNRLERYRVK